ncbi:anti-sigma factor family protein [Actinomadura algeriensis]|uniref:Putative zinc-finger domain-containing protein n=1 Tax=Actinomadura algeriensis TaxID=1679523 RepID=A0ABR9JUS3_9ACTN|nr:zf-HC2 domain-containing protein [Actinomadura algeriensis]MBE1534326.1 hypothetical protein [Actinomadura algeriensis]
MSCLGERLTALVDGELGHDERDRAHAHLAVCARCRAEAATLRSLKGRLAGLGNVPEPGADDLPTDDFLTRLRALGGPAEPSGRDDSEAHADTVPADDFLTRLRALGGPAEPSGPAEPPPGLADAPGGPPATPGRRARLRRSSTRPSRPGRAAAFAGPRDTRPAGHAAGLARPRRRYLVMGAATLVLGLGTASYAAGGRQQGPMITPEFDRYAIEHAMTSGDAPVTTSDAHPLSRTGGAPPTPGTSASPGTSAVPGTGTSASSGTEPVASPGTGAGTPAPPVASPVHAGP